jgi:hypothetical protein
VKGLGRGSSGREFASMRPWVQSPGTEGKQRKSPHYVVWIHFYEMFRTLKQSELVVAKVCWGEEMRKQASPEA